MDFNHGKVKQGVAFIFKISVFKLHLNLLKIVSSIFEELHENEIC